MVHGFVKKGGVFGRQPPWICKKGVFFRKGNLNEFENTKGVLWVAMELSVGLLCIKCNTINQQWGDFAVVLIHV